MTKIIQDIWILLNQGLVIFKRVFDESMDTQLFGGFMSALNSFASQINEEGLSNFELGEKRFFILKRKNLLFIANCGSNIKPKNAVKELENVANKFVKTYPEDFINEWNGNVSFFDDFEKIINDSLESAIDKLKNSFW